QVPLGGFFSPLPPGRAPGAEEHPPPAPHAGRALDGLLRHPEPLHDQPPVARAARDADALLLHWPGVPLARSRAGAAPPVPPRPGAPQEGRIVTEGILEVDPEIFGAYFDRKPFHVRHALSCHPLFALPRLLDLARALPDRFVEYNAGALPVGSKPEDTPRTGLSAEETIRRIQDCGSWMVAQRVEQDPAH